MNTATKVALRDAVAGGGRGRRRTGGAAHRAPATGPSASGQDLKEHIGLLAGRETGRGDAMTHRAPSTTTRIVAGADRDAASRWWPGSTASRPARASASRSPRTTGSSPTPPPSTPSFAGVALTADSGRLLDAAPADRPGRAADLLLFPRSFGRRRRTSWASRTGWSRPPSWPPRRRRWPAPWPTGPTRGVRARSRSPWPTGSPLARARPWRRRTSSRRGPGASEDHAIAVAGVRRQGEAEVPGPLTAAGAGGAATRATAARCRRARAGPRRRSGLPAGSAAARDGAVGQVVVDQPARLHQGVRRGRARRSGSRASSGPSPAPSTPAVTAGTSASVLRAGRVAGSGA